METLCGFLGVVSMTTALLLHWSDPDPRSPRRLGDGETTLNDLWRGTLDLENMAVGWKRVERREQNELWPLACTNSLIAASRQLV